MVLGLSQSLIEMSRNLPGGKVRPACKADNFTAFFEPRHNMQKNINFFQNKLEIKS
jgi:hypothetical protein